MPLDGFALALRTFGALLLVLGILLAFYLAVRRWGERLRPDSKGPVEVLGTRMLLPKKYISVVRVLGTTLVLGVSEGGITLLQRFEEKGREEGGEV